MAENKVVSFKELRQAKGGVKNLREWDYETFQFKTTLPTPRIEQEAEEQSRKEFFKLLQEGSAKADSQLLDFAEEVGLFSREEKRLGGDLDEIERDTQRELVTLQDNLDKLAPTDSSIESLKESETWEETVDISTQIRQLRQTLMDISTSRQVVTSGSAQSQADAAKNTFLIVSCTYVNISEKDEEAEWVSVWGSVDDFMEEEDRTLANLARAGWTNSRVIKF